MFALCVLAAVCLVTVSSAPLACEELVRPSDRLGLDHLAGTWVMVAGGLSDAAQVDHFKSRDSAIIHFANTSESSKLSFRRAFGFGSSCRFLHSNISLEGSSFNIGQVNFSVTFLFTSCPDCLVMHFDNQQSKMQRLYLFSRRRELEPREMEEHKAQSLCLNMIPPVLMDPTKELCPVKAPEGDEETDGH